MKILDVDLLQDGLQRNIAMLERLQNEVGNIQNTVKELVAMEEVLKGAGGSAIRGFYSDVHLPFLHFFLVFSDSYKQKLQQIEAALLSLEPDTAGYILEQFLEGELEQGLTLIANITERLTNEANSIMDTVSDIVALPHLNDSEVQEGVQNSKKKRDDTVLQLHEFDSSQTTSLTTVEADIQTMGNWLVDMEGMFTSGVKDITFQPSQWNAITFGSEIRTELFPKVYLEPHKLWVDERDKIIGTMITAKTFQALELKRMITIDENVGENIQYHQYANGLLIKEYSENGTVYYEIVSKVEYKEEAVQVEPPKENKLLDGFQFVLDLAGLIPGIGEIADGLNGVIYYARGDKLNAGLSFAAMVPFLGWGSTGTKIVNKGRNFFQPKNVLNDEIVESVSTSVYRDMVNSPLIGSQSQLNLFTSLQNRTPYTNNSPFMFNMPTSKTPSGGVHPEIQNPNVANKTPDLDGNGANTNKGQASAVQPPSKGNTPEAKSAVASPTKGNPNEQIQDLPKVVGGNGDHINLSSTTIPNKSTKTVTTPTAKANNPAPVNSGKANVKSETPNSNILAKPKVVGGNGDYTVPPKNTKTINTPSAKVDTTPTNKSIDSNVNSDVKSVDVETKGTNKPVNSYLKNINEFLLKNKEFDEVLDDYATAYAEKVNSNVPWKWRNIPGGDTLTQKQLKLIRERAKELGEVLDVPMKPRTKYPDFEKADLIIKIDEKAVVIMLPKEYWKKTDPEQFSWLDSKIFGGKRPPGTTWHHSEIDGRMELVPFGIHNSVYHSGGRVQVDGHMEKDKKLGGEKNESRYEYHCLTVANGWIAGRGRT
ncbi:T7SS effector LXG polymorphic toxin [Psychrobacillus sp. FSL K6-4046]|uniref:T7SS effector LXG polymorphic toxin n=2 Tax=Psychrobacillus TaxID=1221880 RepID=UPI00315B349C